MTTTLPLSNIDAMDTDQTSTTSSIIPTNGENQTPTANANAVSSQAKPGNFAAFPDIKSLKSTKDTIAKILIVEDETDAREMFVDLLESENYDVSSAVDGNDATAKAAADKFDLILLDLVMPNKDGLETLQDIKSDPIKFGTPIVVVLTNISGDAAVEKAMELGAAGYRLKIEVEPDQLLKDVTDFLNGKKQDIEVEKVGRSLI